jgi:Recombinase
MPDRIRDLIIEPITMDYVKRRQADGWVAAAVEWVKSSESEASKREAKPQLDEVPYGQRISADCRHLMDDPREMNLLTLIYERVVAGWRPARIAIELNKDGHHTRSGAQWTPAAVFDLMPRLIELSPKFAGRPDWPSRRAALQITI